MVGVPPRGCHRLTGGHASWPGAVLQAEGSGFHRTRAEARLGAGGGLSSASIRRASVIAARAAWSVSTACGGCHRRTGAQCVVPSGLSHTVRDRRPCAWSCVGCVRRSGAIGPGSRRKLVDARLGQTRGRCAVRLTGSEMAGTALPDQEMPAPTPGSGPGLAAARAARRRPPQSRRPGASRDTLSGHAACAHRAVPAPDPARRSAPSDAACARAGVNSGSGATRAWASPPVRAAVQPPRAVAQRSRLARSGVGRRPDVARAERPIGDAPRSTPGERAKKTGVHTHRRSGPQPNDIPRSGTRAARSGAAMKATRTQSPSVSRLATRTSATRNL